MTFLNMSQYLIAYNVPRAGDRNPVLRLRQGYGACTLLRAGYSPKSFFFNKSNSSFEMIPFSNNVEYFNNSSALDC